jgi:hypothetical protein
VKGKKRYSYISGKEKKGKKGRVKRVRIEGRRGRLKLEYL